jgi:hypothetical protein
MKAVVGNSVNAFEYFRPAELCSSDSYFLNRSSVLMLFMKESYCSSVLSERVPWNVLVQD